MIINVKVILREFLDPSNVKKAQVFLIYKLTEVVIVGEDKSFKFVVFSLIVPNFKSFNNRLRFVIRRFIPSFNKNYLSKKKTTGYHQIIFLDLEKSIYLWLI